MNYERIIIVGFVFHGSKFLLGVLLRNTGQKGDAERMFIQAKYLAPPEARAVVNRVIANQ
eukprot:scaffold52430_cov33-Prasinocladus_malaysianus.AAC.1